MAGIPDGDLREGRLCRPDRRARNGIGREPGGGPALLPLVIYLGFLTAASQPSTVRIALFGIASALVAPTGLYLVFGAIRHRQNQLLGVLATSATVEQRLAEAKTYEQKVAALKEEQARMTQIVALGVRRQVLEDRRGLLEKEVGELSNQANQVLAELSGLEDESLVLQ